MPDQTPADLIREYLTNQVAIEVADGLKKRQKELLCRIAEAVHVDSWSKPVQLFDAVTCEMISVSRSYDPGGIEIKAAPPTSIESLAWPTPEPEDPADSADASDRFLAESASQGFELPAVAEVEF